MTRTVLAATLLALTAGWASAQCDRDAPRAHPPADPPAAADLPTIERLDYERGIEWGGYHPELELDLERRPDGTYLATYAVRDGASASDVVVAAGALDGLRRALAAMKSFPNASFAGEGNHWYTDFDVAGAGPDGAPWRLDRWAFDTNASALHAKVVALEDAVARLIERIEAGDAGPPPQRQEPGGLAGALPR